MGAAVGDIFDEIASSASDVYQTPMSGPATSMGGDIFDQIASSTPEPSFISNVGGDIKALPGGLVDTAKAVPSGISNLWNSVVSPVQSINNGTTEKALRGTGTLASMLAGGGVGAETGAGLGTMVLPGVGTAVGGVLGGALGAAAGYMGYNDLNQATGSDAPTTAAQDMSAFRRNVVQGTILGGLGEATGIAGSKLLGPQTKAGAMSTVGDALKKYADPTELSDAIKANKSTPMGGMKTSAEVLQSPELAIMEQSLGSSAEGALPYAAAKQQRGEAAQFILDQVSPAKAVDTELTGATVKNVIIDAKKASWDLVQDAYKKIPDGEMAKINDLKKNVFDAKNQFFGPGSPKMSSRLSDLYNRTIGGGIKRNSASPIELQRIRSDALEVAGDAIENGKNYEGALATAIADNIKTTLEKSTVGPEWSNANKLAADHHSIFSEGPLSNVLDRNILPSKIMNKLLSSPEASMQAVKMVNSDPVILGNVKDQLVSDLSNMTDAQRANFIDKNESQLQTLLGNDFQYLDAVRNDIRSRIDTQKLANATGGSNTALKLSGVIEKALTGKTPKVEPGGLWDKLIKGIATGTGITAAYTHPLVTIPAVAAAAGVKALRGRSNSLIQDVLGKSLMHPEVLQKALATKAVPLSPLFAALPAVLGTANNNNSDKSMPLQSLISNVLTPQKPTSSTDSAMSKMVNGGSMDSKPGTPQMVTMAPTAIPSSLADTHPVPPELVHAVALQESSGNPNAVGPRNPKTGKTAKGLMQLEDETGKEWHDKLGLSGDYNPFNKDQNKKIGQAYLSWLSDQFHGDIKLALAAYNAGIGRIQKLMQQTGAATFDELKPALKKAGLDETLAYVPSVLNRQKLIESA